MFVMETTTRDHVESEPGVDKENNSSHRISGIRVQVLRTQWSYVCSNRYRSMPRTRKSNPILPSCSTPP